MMERLLSWLSARANSRGVVLGREEAICSELHVTPGVLAGALVALEREDLAEVLAPLPFLVVRLKKWSGRHANAGESGASAYSHSKQLSQTRRLKGSYRPSGAPATDLLREILQTLGETDATSFEKAVELYSPHIIRTALDRVRRAREIRKSRTALFRHLLPRLARENQDPD